MKKSGKIILTALALTIAMSSTALAGTWKQDNRGWWYQEKNMAYPSSQWNWIDGNGDGLAECYYFDQDGYILTDTTTPDGYTVNKDGAWVDQGIVKEKAMTPAAQIELANVGKRLYMEASNKTSALNSMAATAKIDMNMSMDGTAFDMAMNMDMKFKDLNTSNMKFYSQTSTNLLGQNVSLTVFYTDGYYYMDTNGQKMKLKMDLDQMISQAKDSLQMSDMQPDYMKNFQVSYQEDGSKVVSYEIDPQALLDQMNAIYSMLGMDTSQYQISFRDMNGTSVITSDGYCKSEVIKMTMDMKMSDQTITTHINMDMAYVNPGQPVKFDLPSLEGYQEMAQ